MVLVEMLCKPFDCIDCRMLLWVWVDIVPVEVIAEGIHPEVPIMDSVDIDHRHHHKHEHLSEQIRPQVLFTRQKLEHPLHSIRSRRLRRMHSSRDEHHWFPKHQRPIILWKQLGIKHSLMFRILLIMRTNSQQMYRPILRTERQNLLMVVKLLNIEVIAEPLQHADVIPIRKRIAECEIHDIRFLFEEVLEAHLHYIVFADEDCCLAGQSQPLSVVVDFVHWPVGVGVLGLVD